MSHPNRQDAHGCAPRRNGVALAISACALPVLLVATSCRPKGEHAVQGPAENVFYVAPDGSDRWSGTSPGPNAAGTDGPFATLERARDAIRKLRARQRLQGPVRVQLRGGVHRRAKPFILRPQDSGTAASPVVYESCAGEKAVVSGGRPISGWKKAKDGLWTVELPDVKAGDWAFRQLFVNGQRRQRPRIPRTGMRKVEPLPKDAAKLAKRAFRFRAGDIRPDWANREALEVVVLQYWMEARLRIQELDEASRVVAFTGGSWRPLTWSRGYYVDNVFEGLEQPGTWYLDRKAGVLHYHPLRGEDLAKAEVVAPVAEQLVQLKGDAKAGQLVRDVTLRGLTFCHTGWRFPRQGFAWPQGELPPPAAIHADGAAACRIERCTFEHLGAWAIELRRGCRGNAIVGNTLRDIGAGCIKVGEPKDCADDIQETRGTLISDNRFLGGGQMFFGSPCVWIGQSSGNTVSHNEVTGAFQWAVSVGWRWSYFPMQRARDNLVEFNHFHHIGTGPLGSHAVIYALGTSPGTVIRNNHVHHAQAMGSASTMAAAASSSRTTSSTTLSTADTVATSIATATSSSTTSSPTAATSS